MEPQNDDFGHKIMLLTMVLFSGTFLAFGLVNYFTNPQKTAGVVILLIGVGCVVLSVFITRLVKKPLK